MSASHTREPIAVTHEGGLAFAAQVRSHRLLTDQPVHAGGADSGPTPLELIGASLGTCIAFYVHQFCVSRGLPDEGLRIEVLPHNAPNPSRIARFDVTVRLATELPPHAMEMLERVARSCPAHNTLATGAAMSLHFATPSRAVGATPGATTSDA